MAVYEDFKDTMPTQPGALGPAEELQRERRAPKRASGLVTGLFWAVVLTIGAVCAGYVFAEVATLLRTVGRA